MSGLACVGVCGRAKLAASAGLATARRNLRLLCLADNMAASLDTAPWPPLISQSVNQECAAAGAAEGLQVSGRRILRREMTPGALSSMLAVRSS